MKIVKQAITAFTVLAAGNLSVSACPWCRIQVKSGIYDENFVATLLILLLPVFILAGIGFGLYNFDKILNKFKGVKK